MSRILESVLVEHDLRLVLLAAVICVFGAITTMNVSGRALRARRAVLWLLLVSVCAGATTWSTHFIAMLAFMQDISTTYDPGLTALSFLSGVVIMGAGFTLAIRRHQTRWVRFAAGVVVGVGVITLHFVGMAAVRMPGELTYSPGLVALSVVFSIGFGAPALGVSFGSPSPRARMIGAALLVIMIVTLHFTAMGAVHMQHGMTRGGVAGGVTRSVLATAVAVASVSVLLIGLAGAVIDQKVSHRLAAEADRFRTLADGAFEGLIVHRGGVIVDCNSAARQLLGVDESAPEESFAACLDIVVAPKQGPEPNDEGAAEVEIQRPDGSRFPAEICRRRIRLSDGGEGELCAIRDLTQRKEAEARIAHLALHDPLTDLPNRRFFLELAQKPIAQAKRFGEGFAVLALDLDDFKSVNDTHGHAAGDELIRVTADRIRRAVRDTDVCARFGGDEFVIVAARASQPAQTIALAERLMHVLQEPVRLDYCEVAITVSIGIALHPNDDSTIEEMLRNADTAMYRAKSDGKATCRFFEPHMDAALVARRQLERGLRRAVGEGLLTVSYQPVVDAGTRELLGFEALARWTDAELGVVTPSTFIPVAEDTGLIVPIGAFVLREACADAMTWPDALRVAVNLSAVQFRRKGLVETVREALEESGLPGERLELEVTETLLMDNHEEALRQLTQIKKLGVRISMDDFGTGYSALSYLQCFPFDKIKIDRVFVTNLDSNAQNASIVGAVAAMGRSLHMRVVAEGVETDDEADMLLDLHCDEMQGYLISRPMRADLVRAFLDRYAGASASESSASTGRPVVPISEGARSSMRALAQWMEAGE